MKIKLKNTIKKWRHRLEIDTQKEFGKMLGYRQSKISKWECQKEQPNAETAWDISKKLTEITGQRVYMEDLYEPSDE